MDVDAIMDLAITAARDVFGRTVTYTPVGGVAVELVGDYQTSEQAANVGQSVDVSGGAPRLDLRTADLIAEGITPQNRKGTVAGDLVSFTVLDQTHTYEVIDVLPSAPGSTLLVLGRRGE